MSFMVKKPNGTRHLPEKGPDGKYHVDGKLDIASWEGSEETGEQVNTST
jgi:hypothetical protein